MDFHRLCEEERNVEFCLCLYMQKVSYENLPNCELNLIYEDK